MLGVDSQQKDVPLDGKAVKAKDERRMRKHGQDKKTWRGKEHSWKSRNREAGGRKREHERKGRRTEEDKWRKDGGY